MPWERAGVDDGAITTARADRGACEQGSFGTVPEVSAASRAGGCAHVALCVVGAGADFVEQQAGDLVPLMRGEESDIQHDGLGGARVVGISVGIDHDAGADRPEYRGNVLESGSAALAAAAKINQP